MSPPDPVKVLKAALTDHLHIDLRKSGLRVSLDGDALVIDGYVDGIAQKKRALFIAMGIDGVTGVVDRLKVRPATEMTDAEIKDHFMRALAGENTLSGAEITAEVSGGAVDIEGTVCSLTHKRLAGVLAWWVPGSTEVINSLEVIPPEQDSDSEITDALRIVLEKDRLVEAASIGVFTKDRVVTLTGVVGDETQSTAAEADAWYVWGVNEVVNKLKVG